MEVKAIAKDTGMPASKMRPLVDMVRGKRVDEALNLLRYAPSPKARLIAKVVRSAVANAENNFQMDPADLIVVKINVDVARSMRRFRARSRGRASPLHKNSSHVTVIVAEQEG
ncbi:MAG: 50S ribosomal protein L22 [Dehalococcoidales bacterium]